MAGIGGAATFTASKPASGSASELMFVLEQRAPATISHTIMATVAASAFSVSADSTSARVTGAAPFFGGSLAFTAQVSPIGQGSCKLAPGETAGTLTAHFVSIGERAIEDGATATLSVCG